MRLSDFLSTTGPLYIPVECDRVSNIGNSSAVLIPRNKIKLEKST